MGTMICYIFPAVMFITVMSTSKNNNKAMAQVRLLNYTLSHDNVFPLLAYSGARAELGFALKLRSEICPQIDLTLC